MALRTATDAAQILARLDAAVAADPVRHTVLATIAGDVRGGSAGWCAWDGEHVAARSDAARPVGLSAGWSDVDELVPALAGLPALRCVAGPPAAIDTIVRDLGRPVVDGTDERILRCDEVRPPPAVPGTARPAGAADADLLARWRTPYLIDVFGRVPPGLDGPDWAVRMLSAGTTWLWADAGRPVSQAAVRRPLAGVARIGPVYTPPEHRGRGYASAVTAVAAQAVLAAGAVPVLMTDLANPTSNKIYEAIGFRPVADRRSVWFE